MKKLFLVVLVTFMITPAAALAAEAQWGEACTVVTLCASGLTCVNGFCDFSSPSSSTVTVGFGASCDPNDANSCPLGQACDPTLRTCEAAGQINGLNPSQSLNIGPPAQGQFVPITSIPGLTDNANVDIVSFLGNLYKFLIGIAAVLAVIQIVHGGVLIMARESIPLHTEGKNLIGQAIFGLVLILAPVLVFSIINPEILKFSLFASDNSQAIKQSSSASAPSQPASGGVTTPGYESIGCPVGSTSTWCYGL